ncbi:hypothetical protein HK405_008327, partial [Cladochytrium tenue]
MDAATKSTRPMSDTIENNIVLATSETQQDIDWMHIIACFHLINANPAEGSSRAMKALKLRMMSKDPKVVISYSIIVLDALVNSCGRPFAIELASKDNLAYLRKFLLREDLVPENRGRMLELISDWAEHLSDPPEIRMFFRQLIKQGFRFPPSVNIKPSATRTVPAVPAARPWSKIQGVSPSELSKRVAFDCNLSDSYLQMFVEAVNFADRGVPLANIPIVQEFKGKCEDMQKRLTGLIDKVTEEELV